MRLGGYIYENFPLFSGGGDGIGSVELKQHFENWEWVNFLSFIAESKVFDRANGMTSIDNAREASLHDVLIYASEKKSYENAYNKYMERKYKTT